MHIETNGLSGDEEGRGPGKERPAVAGGQQDRPGLVLLSGHWLTRRAVEPEGPMSQGLSLDLLGVKTE